MNFPCEEKTSSQSVGHCAILFVTLAQVLSSNVASSGKSGR